MIKGGGQLLKKGRISANIRGIIEGENGNQATLDVCKQEIEMLMHL